MTQRTILGVTLRRLIISFVNGLGTSGCHIQVRFRGRRAYTNGTMINLPAIKDMAEIKYETARALMGYAIHEAAHIRHTNFNAIIDAIKAGKMEADCLVKKFANGIEDYRIERIESKALPGTASDLTALRNLIHPMPDKLPAAWYADPRQSGPLALTWTGSQLNGFIIPPMHDTLRQFPPPMRALIDNWTTRMDGVATTVDVIELAVTFHQEALDYVKASQSGPTSQSKSSDQSKDQDADDNNQDDASSPDSDANPDDGAGEAGSTPASNDESAEAGVPDRPNPCDDETSSENTSVDMDPDNRSASGDQTDPQLGDNEESGRSDPSAADPASGNDQSGDTQEQAPPKRDTGRASEESSSDENPTSGDASTQEANHDNEADTSAQDTPEIESDTHPNEAGPEADANCDRTNPQTGTDLSNGTAGDTADGSAENLQARGDPPQSEGDTSTEAESGDEQEKSPDDDAGSTPASEPDASAIDDSSTNDSGDEDHDELSDVLEDNADFDDFLDDLHDQIAQHPLPDNAPDGDDGEVNPGSVIEDIKAANDVAPNYTSPDPDPNTNQSGKAGQGAAPHGYSDTRFHPIETNEGMGKYSELRSKASGVIATTARTIRRLLMAEEQKGTLRGRRSGQFDIRNISAVVRGTGNCYKKSWERPAPETELLILTDFSGSMFFGKGEKPINLAMTGALAVEEATRNTQIQTSIYGYHGASPHVSLYPFKEGKQAATVTKKRIGAFDTIGSGCTPTGEAMAAAAEILDAVPGKRRVLLVLTDGIADDNKLCADLIPVLERRNIEVVAIGIQCNSVKDWCPKSHVINDIAELPTALLSVIDPRANKKLRKAA